MIETLILAHGTTQGGPSTWHIVAGTAIDAAPYLAALALAWGAWRLWRRRPIRGVRRG